MKYATSISHGLQIFEQIIEEVHKDIPIIEKAIEDVIEKIIEVIPVIEKDISTVEKLFGDVSIESDTVQEPEPVSSLEKTEGSSGKLELDDIYPDYNDEIIDDIPIGTILARTTSTTIFNCQQIQFQSTVLIFFVNLFQIHLICSMFFNDPLGPMKLIINFLLNQIKSTVFILSGD